MPNIQNCVRQVGDFQPLVIIDSRTRKTKFLTPTNVSFMSKTFRFAIHSQHLCNLKGLISIVQDISFLIGVFEKGADSKQG